MEVVPPEEVGPQSPGPLSLQPIGVDQRRVPSKVEGSDQRESAARASAHVDNSAPYISRGSTRFRPNFYQNFNFTRQQNSHLCYI